MARKKVKTGLADALRAAIAERIEGGDSLNRIAQAAGYADHSQLARFQRGERGLTVGAKLDGLLRELGLQVKERGDG